MGQTRVCISKPFLRSNVQHSHLETSGCSRSYIVNQSYPCFLASSSSLRSYRGPLSILSTRFASCSCSLHPSLLIDSSHACEDRLPRPFVIFFVPRAYFTSARFPLIPLTVLEPAFVVVSQCSAIKPPRGTSVRCLYSPYFSDSFVVLLHVSPFGFHGLRLK